MVLHPHSLKRAWSPEENDVSFVDGEEFALKTLPPSSLFPPYLQVFVPWFTRTALSVKHFLINLRNIAEVFSLDCRYLLRTGRFALFWRQAWVHDDG
jgi:hypothetical protein